MRGGALQGGRSTTPRIIYKGNFMNISVKIETQISKEEFDKGIVPEIYTVVFKSKDEASFRDISDNVRAYIRESFSPEVEK